jgi:hypothetical protein
MAVRTMRTAIALLLVLGGGVQAVQAQAPVAPEQVKAAFLYNFAGFVTWPPGTGAEAGIVIGVMSDAPLEGELRRSIAARTLQTRPVTIRHVASAEDTEGIHILYIGMRENPRLQRIIASLRNRPILVVTEAADGLESGSMINFITTDRVQFEIALDATARAGLQLNARLLSVATRIRKGESGERSRYA